MTSPLWRALAGLFLGLNIQVALAGPLIPSSEMPGRERERFTESPVERFMQPGPYLPPPVVTTIPPGCKHPASKPQSKTGKNC
jgi:hypothetical protein